MITPNVKGRLKSAAVRRLLICVLLGAITAFAAVPRATPKAKPTPVPLRARPGSTPPPVPTPPPPPLSSR